MAPSNKRKQKSKKKSDAPRHRIDSIWLPVINADNHELFQAIQTVPPTYTFLYKESNDSGLVPKVVQLDTSSENGEVWAKPLLDTKSYPTAEDVDSTELYIIEKLHLESRDACALTLMLSTEIWGEDHFTPDWLDIATEAKATADELLKTFVDLKVTFLRHFTAGDINKAVQIGRSLAEYWQDTTGEKEDDPDNYFDKHEITGEKILPAENVFPADKVPRLRAVGRDYWVIVEKRAVKDKEFILPANKATSHANTKMSETQRPKTESLGEIQSDCADLVSSTMSGDLGSTSEFSEPHTSWHDARMILKYLNNDAILQLPSGTEENPSNPYVAPPPDPESIKFMIQVPILNNAENKKIVRGLISVGVDSEYRLAGDSQMPVEKEPGYDTVQQGPQGKKKKYKNKKNKGKSTGVKGLSGDSSTQKSDWTLWESAPNPQAPAPSPDRFPIYATGDLLKSSGINEFYAIIPVKGLKAYRKVNQAIFDLFGAETFDRAFTIYTSKRHWRLGFSSEKYGSERVEQPGTNTEIGAQATAKTESVRIRLPPGSRYVILIPSQNHDLADFRALEKRMGSCEAAVEFSIQHDLDLAYVVEPTETTLLSLVTEEEYYMIYPSDIEDAKLSNLDLECINRGKTVAITNSGHTAPMSTHHLEAIYRPSDESRAGVRLVNKILDAAIKKGDRKFVNYWQSTFTALRKVEEQPGGKLNPSFAKRMVKRLLSGLKISDVPVVSVDNAAAFKKAADQRADGLFKLFGKPEPAYMFMMMVQDCVEDAGFKSIDFDKMVVDENGDEVKNESAILGSSAETSEK